ncbi:MAG: hypothetical protein Fur0027_22340 [Raineya sp.]
MKKVLIPFGFVMFLLVGASFTIPSPKPSPENAAILGGFVKILNDTPNSVEIHTGSGYTTLGARGGTTSVSCEEGKKIYLANNGKKGKLIFTIDDSMCGKTVKLSAYL